MTRVLVLCVVLGIFAMQDERPWMQGSVEIGCSRHGGGHDGHDTDGKVKEWKTCSCQHSCDPQNKETQGRKWDATCSARCSPRHCHCADPCKHT